MEASTMLDVTPKNPASCRGHEYDMLIDLIKRFAVRDWYCFNEEFMRNDQDWKLLSDWVNILNDKAREKGKSLFSITKSDGLRLFFKTGTPTELWSCILYAVVFRDPYDSKMVGFDPYSRYVKTWMDSPPVIGAWWEFVESSSVVDRRRSQRGYKEDDPDLLDAAYRSYIVKNVALILKTGSTLPLSKQSIISNLVSYCSYEELLKRCFGRYPDKSDWTYEDHIMRFLVTVVEDDNLFGNLATGKREKSYTFRVLLALKVLQTFLTDSGHTELPKEERQLLKDEQGLVKEKQGLLREKQELPKEKRGLPKE
ncbi:hypothetical protein F5Y19DRAFT_478599 [Xylariaceae sp. FL1651]|nr:hypothetical protein F5Y19DRAFT_478599 [Xylariaceae sp. FL1651]